MDRNYILAIKNLAQTTDFHTVELDPADIIELCDLALKQSAPDPLSQALNEGDGTYRP